MAKLKLTPPKKITFWISLVIVAVGILASFLAIPILSPIALWVVVIGYILLVLGLLIKGF
jgi:heme/copper-type cytochrome/quinol oxidase subunit 1